MYIDFENWLNRVLDENVPIEGVAINFNLYEDADMNWSIQLISASSFDEEDQDWCCEEQFTSGEDLFSWHQDTGWEEIFDISCDMIRKYLIDGKYSEELKKYEAVAAGFADGDLEIIYKK